MKGYNIDIIKQSAYLAVDPITADYFAYLLICTTVSRGSDSMMAPTRTIYLDGLGWNFFMSVSRPTGD